MSAKARDLNTAIEWQDNLYAMALVENASPKFLERIRAVRNDLTREWGAQILKDQFDEHIRVGA